MDDVTPSDSGTWRVRPLPRPTMAVEVDGWYELAIKPAHPLYPRTDVIAEKVPPSGHRDVSVFIGSSSASRVLPVLPDGYQPIATIRVLPGQNAIAEWSIGAP